MTDEPTDPERCAFRHPVSEWESRVPVSESELEFDLADDLPDGGTYRCPRAATEPDGKCPFHSERTDDDAVADAVVHLLESSPDPSAFAVDVSEEDLHERWLRVFGLEVTRLDLSNVAIDGTAAAPLDLRWLSAERVRFDGSDLPCDGIRLGGSRIGRLSFEGVEVAGDVTCDVAEIRGSVRFGGAEIAGDCRFDAAAVGGSIRGEDAAVDGQLRFVELDGGGDLRLADARVTELLYFREATIEGSVDCRSVRVEGEHPKADVTALQFRGTTVGGRVVLRKGEVDGTLLGNELTVGADLDLREATLTGEIWLGGYFGDIADLDAATVGGSVLASELSVGGEFDTRGTKDDGKYDGTTIGGVLRLDRATLGELVLGHSQGSLPVVSCRDATVGGGEIEQPADGNRLAYDFAGATVGDVVLDDSTSLDRDFRFLETTFDGFNFGGARRPFSRGGWRIHEVADPTAVAAGGEYERTAELARDAAVVFAVYPEVAAAVVDRRDEFDPERIGELLFEGRHDVPRIAKKGVQRYFHPTILERENLRRGFVTHVAEWLDGRSPSDFETLRSNAAARDHLSTIAYRVGRLVDGAGRNGEPSTEAVERALTDPYVTAAIHDLASTLALASVDAADAEPTLGQLESTYLEARNGADEVGDTVAGAEFYVRELGTRRRRHLRRALDRSRPFPDRLRAGYDYVSNALLWHLSGYGERPRHVVLWAGLTVVGFAAAFAVAGALSETFPAPGGTYDGPVGYLLLSFESFTTLVHGGTEIRSRPVRLLADVEGFLGAFFIALFVFTLTRSLER